MLPALASQLTAQEQIIYLCDAGQRERLGFADTERMRWEEVATSPFSLPQQWVIPRLIRRIGAHVYHSPYYLMPYWPGTHTALTVYDIIPLRFPDLVSARAQLLFRWTTRLALRKADKVIAISDSTRRDFLANFELSAQQVVTIPLAPAAHFRPSSSDVVERLRAKLGLKRPYVLYVGSNKPHKNLERLLQAWRLALEQLHAPYDLVLAGHWDRQDENFAQQLKDPLLRGTVRLFADTADSELASLYSGAELFVFPSLYEGFGLPVLEAMSCGCAVVCSDRASLPELIGQAGALFDPEQPTAIAQTIVKVLSDQGTRREYVVRALENAAAYTWEATAARTLDIYRRLSRSATNV